MASPHRASLDIIHESDRGTLVVLDQVDAAGIRNGEPCSSAHPDMATNPPIIVSPRHHGNNQPPPATKGILRGGAATSAEKKRQTRSAILLKCWWDLISNEDSLWIVVVLPVVTLCGDQVLSFLSPWSKTFLLTITTAFCLASWAWSIYSYYLPTGSTDGTSLSVGMDHKTSSSSAPSFMMLKEYIYSPKAKERIRRVRFVDATKLHIIPRKDTMEGHEGGNRNKTDSRWSNGLPGRAGRLLARQHPPRSQNIIQRDPTTTTLMRLQAAVGSAGAQVPVTAATRDGDGRCGPSVDPLHHHKGPYFSVGKRRHSLPPPVCEDGTIPGPSAPVPTLMKEPDSTANPLQVPARALECDMDIETNEVSKTPQAEATTSDEPVGIRKSGGALPLNPDSRPRGCDPMESLEHVGNSHPQNADVTSPKNNKPSPLPFLGAITPIQSRDSCSSLSSLEQCPSDEWGGCSLPSDASELESMHSENESPGDPVQHQTKQIPDQIIDKCTAEEVITAHVCGNVDEQAKSPASLRQSSTLPLRAANRNHVLV
jgi:hypothetical protein